jgi:parallel beta-helix repeat protein
MDFGKMNKKSISIVLVVFMVFSVYGVLFHTSFNSRSDTTYGDVHINFDETWDIGESPIWIEGNVTVDPGYTLTIDPGVEVRFNGGYSLFIEGNLNAVGDPSNMIKFTTNLSIGDLKDEDFYNIQINSTGRATIEYSNITYALHGINMSESTNNEIRNNIITNNRWGILLEKSYNNNITKNLIYDNLWIGILLRESYENLISGNNISASFKGINFHESYNNTITSNDIHHNHIQGMLIYLSNNNFIKYNHIYNNSGNGIEIGHSDFNEVFSNNISFNGDSASNYGIKIEANSQLSLLHHNTLFYNFNQAMDATNGSNQWDNGYPLGGNFWSDYSKEDLKRGTNQDIPGSDGLGDTPYVIDSDSYDFYPLMTPMRNIAPFLIALVSPANRSVINNGTVIDLDILVKSGDEVNYSINGGTNITLSDPFNITADSFNWTEGENRLDVYVIDASSNINSSWFKFTFDSLAPLISLVSPLNNSLIRGGDLINISVTDLNMNFVKFRVNNGTVLYLLYPYVIDTTNWPDDDYMIEIFAQDLSGAQSYAFYNFTSDSTSPLISMLSPFNNSYIQPGIPLVYNISDDHLHNVRYMLNGGSEQSFLNNYSINTSSLPDGAYSIAVRANDNVGNVRTSTFVITVDSISPQIILNNPENNSLIQSGVPINFSFVDTNPVRAYYSTDMNEFQVLPTPFLLNTTSFGDGPNTIYLNVTDFAGNQNITSFTFTFDSAAPRILLTGLSNNSRIQPGTSIDFIIVEANLVSANYSVNGGVTESLMDTSSINTTNWPDGTYSINFFLLDQIGNFVRETFVFTVDSERPKIVSTEPKNKEDGVPTDRSIKIKFSEHMDYFSLMNALSISPRINYTPKMSIDNLTLVLELYSDLENLTEYTVVINASAMDMAGNQLSKDYTFSFKTGPKDDDEMDLLVLLLILVIIIVISLIAFILKRRKSKSDKQDEKDKKEDTDEFALKEKPGDEELKKDKEDLLEEGLGEDELVDEELDGLNE